MNMLPCAMAAILALALPYAPDARAGRSCEPRKLTPRTLETSLGLAGKTLEALEASGARVVVLARAGQDLRKYGLHYSHLGLAYRTPAGAWRVVHKLNHCGTAQASLYRQGLGEFFLDDLWRHEAAWAVPTPEVQARLLARGQAFIRVVLHQPADRIECLAHGLARVALVLEREFLLPRAGAPLRPAEPQARDSKAHRIPERRQQPAARQRPAQCLRCQPDRGQRQAGPVGWGLQEPRQALDH